MAWFKKKDKVLDLTEYHKRKVEMSPESSTSNDTVDLTASQPTQESSSGGIFGIFGGGAASSESSTTSYGTTETSGMEDRRQRLAKRLKDMTDKLEDISNQIYHLQQRIEVLERKNDVNRY